MFYSYICDTCNATKNVNHSMNERPNIFCSCNNKKKKMRKEFCTNFICKGPGFPSTQLREKNQREKRSKELKRKQHLTGLSVENKSKKKIKKEEKLFF